MENMVDFGVSDHGSIWLIHPRTPAAQEWLDENVSEEASFMGNALACEARFVAVLLEGMQSDGLTVGKEWAQ